MEPGPRCGLLQREASGFWDGLSRGEVSNRNSPGKHLLFGGYLMFQGWTPTAVDSPRNRSDASEVARCAPQHTKNTEGYIKNNDLATFEESFSGQPRTTCTEKTVSKTPLGEGFRRGKQWADDHHVQHSGTGQAAFGAFGPVTDEPRRVCRRLQLLSRMEHHEQDHEQFFP